VLSDHHYQLQLNYMVSRIRAALKARDDRRMMDLEEAILQYEAAWEVAFSVEVVSTALCPILLVTDGCLMTDLLFVARGDWENDASGDGGAQVIRAPGCGGRGGELRDR
jgi:hypothetical protein